VVTPTDHHSSTTTNGEKTMNQPSNTSKIIHIDTDTENGRVMCGRYALVGQHTNGSGDGEPGEADMTLDDLEHPALCRTCVRALKAEWR
jgi:hypothetical protein